MGASSGNRALQSVLMAARPIEVQSLPALHAESNPRGIRTYHLIAFFAAASRNA